MRKTMTTSLQPRHLLHCTLLSLAVFAFTGAGDPATRFNELGHQMMCICGCNQILLECNHVGCPDSDGMRNELMSAVSRGDSDSLEEQAATTASRRRTTHSRSGTGEVPRSGAQGYRPMTFELACCLLGTVAAL